MQKFRNELKSRFKDRKPTFSQAASAAGSAWLNMNSKKERGEFIESVMVEEGFDKDEARAERERLEESARKFEEEQRKEDEALSQKVAQRQVKQTPLFETKPESVATPEPVKTADTSSKNSHEIFNTDTGEKQTVDLDSIPNDDFVVFTIQSASDEKGFAKAILKARPEMEPHIREWAERSKLDSNSEIESINQRIKVSNEAIQDKKMPAKAFIEKYNLQFSGTNKKSILKEAAAEKEIRELMKTEFEPFEFEFKS